MERLRIRFLYRRGDRVGYGADHRPCTILTQRYEAREDLAPLHTYFVKDDAGLAFYARETDLAPLRERPA